MKKIFLILLSASSITLLAQTKTTSDLHKKYQDAFSLYFYSNTLKMLNQSGDKEFDELVKDIEKMKFLIVDKGEMKFSVKDYSSLIKNYQSEDYENMMTARSNGKNFDVYLREDNNRVKGTLILVNDSSKLYILDIIGRVQPNQAIKFFNALDQNSDITQKLKSFIGDEVEGGNKTEVKID
jgi:Domain of unknown function (DUF4252)